MSWWRRSEGARIATAAAALAAVTFALVGLGVANTATISTTYLMVVLLVATTSRLRVAVGASVAAMLCLNFFFLPPVNTFTIAEPQNWVALFAFLAVSLVASNLSAVARARTDEAEGRRDELARLFDLSRDVLMMTDREEALSTLARSISRRFDLEFDAIAMPRSISTTVRLPMRLPPRRPHWNSMPTRAPMRGTGRSPRMAVPFDSSPSVSGRSRLACSPPLVALSSRGRWMHWPGWWRSASSAPSSWRSAKPAS